MEATATDSVCFTGILFLPLLLFSDSQVFQGLVRQSSVTLRYLVCHWNPKVNLLIFGPWLALNSNVHLLTIKEIITLAFPLEYDCSLIFFMPGLMTARTVRERITVS